ncbi:hypothetical protein OGAPHI_000778 [Ogataea philodendri]|uniref:J domain-containing protein n=1 Tax=Ogataea philodendri TaxID=1378263 RepID=A0A9P8PGX8_9ASCO|nr:uncharacterized protein OGAPHI_000778 [Ogataea philodendri]KAH3671067.1 hypothetical protein OGAPHI_000778 [Ogataea philodendri]
MAQVTQEEFSWLLGREKSAYELLGVEAAVDGTSLRRAYRRRALVLHPDKNQSPSAEDEFREILVSYRVLGDPAWRAQYDEHLARELERRAHATAQTQRQQSLKEQLLSDESKYKQHLYTAKSRQSRVEALKQHTEQLRLEKVRRLGAQAAGMSQDRTNRAVFPCKLKVRWRNKPQMGDLMSVEVVAQLMGVFGPVEHVEMGGGGEALVTFVTWTAAVLAAIHNYAEPCDLWDAMGLSRVAGLLKSARLVGFDDHVNEDHLNMDELVGLKMYRLHKHRTPV